MKLTDIKPGDRVRVDGDFDCMKPGVYTVAAEQAPPLLYIECAHGRHYLDVQIKKAGELVGISPAEERQPATPWLISSAFVDAILAMQARSDNCGAYDLRVFHCPNCGAPGMRMSAIFERRKFTCGLVVYGTGESTVIHTPCGPLDLRS